MTVQERIEASKELVDFVRNFTLLIDRQLKGIRGYMADTVAQVMDSVERINTATGTKKRQAQEVLQADGRSSAPKLGTAEAEVLRASGLFSKHMEAIATLDGEVRHVLFQVIGALSADDVMGQRLIHVISGLGIISRGTSEFMKGFPTLATRAGVGSFRDRILTEVYRGYTMEAEREIFHEVFGAPVRSGTQAS